MSLRKDCRGLLRDLLRLLPGAMLALAVAWIPAGAALAAFIISANSGGGDGWVRAAGEASSSTAAILCLIWGGASGGLAGVITIARITPGEKRIAAPLAALALTVLTLMGAAAGHLAARAVQAQL